MKVLVSTYPYAGHFNPTQPVVEELIRRGHEVLWMTGPSYEYKVTRMGADYTPMSEEALTDDPYLHIIEEPITLSTIADYLRRLWLDRIPAQVRDYRAALENFPADILLVEYCTFGARCLLDLDGVPYATLGVNPLATLDPEIPPWGSGEQPPRTFLGRWWNWIRHQIGILVFYKKLSGWFNDERKKLGLGPLSPLVSFVDDYRSPYLHLLSSTPAFEYPRRRLGANIKFIGPLLPAFDPASFTPPEWWEEMLSHPREKVIHITQGTIQTDAGRLIKPTVEALKGRDDLLVIVTGRNLEEVFEGEFDGTIEPRAPDLPPLSLIGKPRNVRTAAFVPHLKMLPHVGVMITNAGFNGVLAALSCGVPLVCAGKTEDKAEVSARVAWAGAGIDLRTEWPSSEEVGSAVLKIVAEPHYREAAKRIQDDFAKHKASVEAVDHMERLVQEMKQKEVD